ncbi:hypothetical protein DL96DRAFT_1170089 [Flagelloscypha sp. PMI_526]|nr:hypothetical protein DL96DRAFT_1170089 [Flagelloscypha sp. PMI_526]
MKLPEQATLGLQPNYAPGETVPTKLKQAVVIRMSADALNALQTNTSSLHVQFGATPGLYISDSFYSMQPIKEESRHELYLRAASQSKPNAPLKLFANITGKCSVDRLATEPERSDAGSVPRKKKEKESVSMFRKPARPSASTSVTATIVTAPSASSSSSAIRPSLPPAPSRRPAAAAPEAAIPSTNLSMDLRSRMIHCLALHERPIEVLTKAVGAETSQIWVHLKQASSNPIAVPSPNRDNQPGIPYKLIPEAYKEVRPWDWPKLNTNERAVMAKAARDAFTKLGLPPTDPAWSHVDNRPLPPDPVLAPRPAATSDGQAKRGITSKEMRDKKVKPKAEKKEIKIKDEGIRTSANVSTPSLEPGIRRPGSGFKMPRVSPVAETKSVATATSSKAATTSSLSSSQPRLKKVKEEDVGSDRDSLSSRPKVNDSTPAAKRKISSRRNDDDDYDPVAAGSSTKRRKTEEAGRPTQNPVRDLSLPKKPEPPRARIPAPEPVRRVKQEKVPSGNAFHVC